MKAFLIVTCAAAVSFSTSVNARPLTKAEKAIIAESVSRDFKDPSASQFRWMPLPDNWSKVATTDGKPAAEQDYCGMVNGKNSFGAYIGYTAFYVMLFSKSGKVVVSALIGVDNADESATLEMCKEKGLDPSIAQ